MRTAGKKSILCNGQFLCKSRIQFQVGQRPGSYSLRATNNKHFISLWKSGLYKQILCKIHYTKGLKIKF